MPIGEKGRKGTDPAAVTKWQGSLTSIEHAIRCDHFGFRYDAGNTGITIDPYVSHSLDPTIETRLYFERSTIFGLKVGLSRRFGQKPLTRPSREVAPVE